MKIMKQFVFYTQRYVHWFWKCGFHPCKFNTKHYLQKKSNSKKVTCMLEAPAIMEILKKRLNTV